MPRADLGAQVAVGGGDDAHVELDATCVPPTRRTCRFSSARRSFGCSSFGSSPISSRKSVPPSACSNTPAWACDGAGERARARGRRARSRRASALTAPQSKTTNGRRARALARCTDSATRSLPVPVSPSTSRVDVGRRRCARDRRRARACAASTRGGRRSGPPWSARARRSRRTARGRAPCRPARRRASKGTSASYTRTPPAKTPLVEPASRTRIPPATGSISRWWRETESSVRTRSLSSAVPTRTGCPAMSSPAPASGPRATSTRTFE